MGGIDSVIWQFGRERFKSLARQVAAAMRQHEASGIYGDEEELPSEALILDLWDEFQYEVWRGPTDALESAWRDTLRPYLDAALDGLSVAEQQLIFLWTDEGLEFDTESDDEPPIDRGALIAELEQTLRDLAGRGEDVVPRRPEPAAVPPNSFDDIKAFLFETKEWAPLYGPHVNAGPEEIVAATIERIIQYLEWRAELPLPRDAGYRGTERLPVNNWPINQTALRWVREAKGLIGEELPYVVQLIWLGFEHNLPVPGRGGGVSCGPGIGGRRIARPDRRPGAGGPLACGQPERPGAGRANAHS